MVTLGGISFNPDWCKAIQLTNIDTRTPEQKKTDAEIKRPYKGPLGIAVFLTGDKSESMKTLTLMSPNPLEIIKHYISALRQLHPGKLYWKLKKELIKTFL